VENGIEIASQYIDLSLPFFFEKNTVEDVSKD